MKELDVVRLTKEFEGLPAGTEGTIVHKYDDSMYEIEFFSKDGDALNVITTPKRRLNPLNHTNNKGFIINVECYHKIYYRA